MDESDDESTNEGHDRHAEKKPVVALNFDPKHGEVTDNRGAERTQCQITTQPSRSAVSGAAVRRANSQTPWP